MTDIYEVLPVYRPIDASPILPGSKSITNRALLMAALAAGTSRLSGVLFADDTHAMFGALAALGAQFSADEVATSVEVVGIDGAPLVNEARIDAVQSGTTSRFMLPVLAALPGQWTLDCDEQLRARPIEDQVVALANLGARIEAVGDAGRLPLAVVGATLEGGLVEVAGDVSSQFLSGLLMAGPLFADGLTVQVTTQLVSRPYVDMTVHLMRHFGATVAGPVGDRLEWLVSGGGYTAADLRVEPDASAASYAFAAAAITRGIVRVQGLTHQSVQGDVGFVDVLADMGAAVIDDGVSITVDCTDDVSEELEGVDVDMSQISDTAQTLAVVAATADTPTVVTGIGFIRRKETDRIAAVVTELGRLGLDATEDDHGFTVNPGEVHPATIETYGDHRMAMSFALLGLVNDGISVADPGCVAKTFPGYWNFLEGLGVSTSYLVAIDGPAGSGKSTVSRSVADALQIDHFDTGAMYRAVAYAAQDRGISPNDPDAVAAMAHGLRIELGLDNGTASVVVDGVDATRAIRTPEVTAVVSSYSAIPAVRRELVRLQRRYALDRDGCVVEGRDIGTVVFPDAPLKIYLTARVEVRAARRLAEMQAKGLTGSSSPSLEEIVDDIAQRDHVDSSRADSPLRAADDAVVVDTSDRTVEELVDEIAQLAMQAWGLES